MPTLEVDGNVICQSAAIWRYLANEYGLYGANNKEKLVIDQVDETLRDLKVEVMKIRFSKDTEGRKKELTTEFFEKDSTKGIYTFISGLLKKNNGGNGFIVGNKISLADILYYSMDELVAEVYPTYQDVHPELKSLVWRIGENKDIKRYRAARKF